MKKIKLPHTAHSVLALLAAVAFVSLALVGGSALVILNHSTVRPALSAAVEFPFMPQLSPDVLTAKSAILYDPSNGRILFNKNADEQRPLASVTKLMTATVVLASKSPDTVVTITPEDLKPGGDWDGGLKVGQQVTLHELLRIGLIASSNDAMQAAASSLGDNYIQKMNQVAIQLGLSKMYFLNPTGLDVNETTSGAYGSAYDVARLAAIFYKQNPNYLEQTQHSAVAIEADNGKVSVGHATAAPLLSIPGFIGAKTGYTDLAGGNLVALFDVEIGHPLVAVVLGSTQDGRFSDIKTLINAARNPQETQP
jgi:D-alanyl-D-alanine carboxypeptidase (penicillin-binding protein 5/6)